MLFSKMGMAKFISHLDLLRCFERAIMRSGLPVEYSQGFNPHQKMTFALPLPVGVTSECEVVDIGFEDGKVSDAEITQKLNANLPPDIRVIKTSDLIHKAADITRAEYIVKLHSESKIEDSLISDFFAKDEVVVMKRTKKNGEKPINIMEYVRAYELTESNLQSEAGEYTSVLRIVLDAGGERNLKPDVLISKLCEGISSVNPDDAEIHRLRIFCKSSNGETAEIFE